MEAERERIVQNLAAHKVELIHGKGAFADPKTIVVSGKGGERRLNADVVLISTGSKPFQPPDIAFDNKRIFDSDTFLQINRIPESLAVIGGGVIGCEYASVFMALGVKVFLVDGRDHLLPFLDGEISKRLCQRLAELGMKFCFNERPAKIEATASGVRSQMKSGTTLETDAVLFAAGRRASVDKFSTGKRRSHHQ